MRQCTAGSVEMELTVAQSTIVPSAPRVELAISRDGSAVRASASNMDHVLPCLFPIEGCDHCGLFKIPDRNRDDRALKYFSQIVLIILGKNNRPSSNLHFGERFIYF